MILFLNYKNIVFFYLLLYTQWSVRGGQADNYFLVNQKIIPGVVHSWIEPDLIFSNRFCFFSALSISKVL